MDLSSIINSDADSNSKSRQQPPTQAFAQKLSQSPVDRYAPLPLQHRSIPASYVSPTAHHRPLPPHQPHQHALPQGETFVGAPPPGRVHSNSYRRTSTSPYPPLAAVNANYSHPAQQYAVASPSTVSGPVHTPQSFRESPMSATSYTHQSQFTNNAPPSHPTTPLGPPAPPLHRPSSNISRPPPSPYAHRRSNSGASTDGHAAHPQRVGSGHMASPGTYETRSPRLERNGSEVSAQRDRDRTESVSPRTKVPSRSHSIEQRIASHDHDQAQVTPRGSLGSILQQSPQAARRPSLPPQLQSYTSNPQPLNYPAPVATPTMEGPPSFAFPQTPTQNVPEPQLARRSSVSLPSTSQAQHADHRSSSTLSRKRKRHDPVPPWAQKATQNVHVVRSQVRDKDVAQRSATPSGPPNGHQLSHANLANHNATEKLETSITNQEPFDEVTRLVCDFLWSNVIEATEIGTAKPNSRHPTEPVLEIEAKFGKLWDRHRNERLQLPICNEAVLDTSGMQLQFESDMTEAQHQTLNKFLNQTVLESLNQSKTRVAINYVHKRETDTFYELPQAGYSSLPARARALLPPTSKAGSRSRVRVTRDTRTNAVLAAIVKTNIRHLEVLSPRTQFDYRISVNMECPYQGPVEELVELREQPSRRKDRMCYSHQSYQVDLTQVVKLEPGSTTGAKTHELEVELDADEIRLQAEAIKEQRPSRYEEVVRGFVNNIRILARALE